MRSEPHLFAPANIARTVGKAAWRTLKAAAAGIDAGLDAATSIPLNRLRKANAARAMNNPVYADIEARRRIDGSTLVTLMSTERNLGLDEWNTQDDILDAVARHPWWEAPARALSRRHLSAFLSSVEHAAQRVTRGWDDTAVWSLDDHLARTLGAQLTHLAAIAHGHPAGEEYSTYEAWTADLSRHGAALTAYATRWDKHLDDGVEFPQQYADAQAAIRWAADHLDCLWD